MCREVKRASGWRPKKRNRTATNTTSNIPESSEDPKIKRKVIYVSIEDSPKTFEELSKMMHPMKEDEPDPFEDDFPPIQTADYNMHRLP
jgi:hypothetical protein